MIDPKGLGVDWLGMNDLDFSGELVEGILCLAQDVVHRLSTPRGGLFYDETWGLDLRAYLEEGLTAQRLAAIPSEVSSEVEKDERVKAATVTASFNQPAELLVITIALQTALGPFTLVLAIDKLNVTLLKLES